MKNADKEQRTSKTWQKTRVQNLVRHKSGRYYARLFEGGGEKWKSLKTDHFGVAQAKLAEILKEHKKRKAVTKAATTGKMTAGAALNLHLQRLEHESAAGVLKASSLRYWMQTADYLKKTWPELEGAEIRKITVEDCQQWAARTAPKTSDTRFNNTISILRSIFKIGIDSGVIYVNPAESVKRVVVRKKDLTLPTRAQFRAILDVMKAHSRGGYQLAAGLAYTGMRVEEAACLTWGDVDFVAGEITVRGNPETGTKNSEVRRVPLTPSAIELLQGMDDDTDPTKLVFRVRSCIKSLQRACKTVGARSISHHDLRHYFATACIESGVDIPTISRWLGHKDGGALAMKTYGHLRREHSIAAAAKVMF